MQAQGLGPLFLVLLAACAVTSSAAAANETTRGLVEVHVSTGQELADAVADWGAAGSDMTIYIDVPYISVRNASFTSYSTIAARSRAKPFSQGKLVIRGQDTQDQSQPITILDAGMRSGLFPVPLTYPARYSLEQLVLINLCEVQYGVFYLQGGSTPPTPFGVELFGLTSTYQGQWLINLAMYGRQAAVAFAGYRIVMEQSSHIAELKNYTTPVVQGTQQTFLDIDGNLSSAHDLFIKYYPLSLGVYKNMSYRSLFNPDDALLAQLMTDGKLMPPQCCNGTLIPQQLVDAEVDAEAETPSVSPYWMASTQSDFARGLQKAAAQTTMQAATQGPPPMLVTLTGRFALPDIVSVYLLDSTLYITGLRTGPRVQIDLRQQVAVFGVTAGATLILHLVELINLPTQVPTQLPPGLSPGNLMPSVFPLAAFKSTQSFDTWHNFSSVVMFNTTLVIPPDDYLALLILASKQAGQAISSCADAAPLQRAAQLQAGFHLMRFSLPTPDALQQPLLYADELQGWGLHASLLTLLPSSPVQLPSCSSSRSSRMALAFAVSSSGIALVSMLVWWVLCQRKHAQKAAASESAEKQCRLQCGYCTAATAGEAMDTDVTTVSYSLAGKPLSMIRSGVQASCAQQQVLLDAVVDPSGSKSFKADAEGSPATLGDMMNQVLHLAGQMNGQDSNQVVLAGVLGCGGGGTVMMGIWKGLKVAVKTVLMHSNPCATQNSESKVPDAARPCAFMEAAIAASVGHPNLVSTYHYDIKTLANEPLHSNEQGGLQIDSAFISAAKDEVPTYKLFLLQELCHMSLATALENNLFMFMGTKQLDFAGVLVILLDVARGLAYLHSKGIIHGDLKPENIMLKLDSSVSEGVVAKLTDFGLSMKLGPDATHVSNWSFGSPFYVAPEVVCSHHMSTASDVYSFGVVCWAVYMQHPPYIKSMSKHYTWHPLYPRFHLAHPPPPEFACLFDRCCSKDPKMRPSACEMVKILETLILKDSGIQRHIQSNESTQWR